MVYYKQQKEGPPTCRRR